MTGVLLWMLALAPRAPAERLVPLAEVIAVVTPSRLEQAELTTLAFVETTLGRAGIPFGVSCCHRRGMPLEAAAARALAIMRDAWRQCGRDLAARHGYYRTGRCAVDVEAQRRARITRRLLRHRWAE